MVMEYTQRKNINRGYRKLCVWQDAIEYYALTCGIFMKFPYELKRIASNHIASVDSIHRNIAEGFCRRSLKEYLVFLNYALASAGESVSGLHAYMHSGQIATGQFEEMDQLAYKIENGLKKLIESLQLKQQDKDWDDSFIIKESNVQYLTERERADDSSILPPFQTSNPKAEEMNHE
ncbi:MAG: four helix bundle protein [Kiritimatiellales bacterium]